MTNVLPENKRGSQERIFFMTRRKTHQRGCLTFLADEMSTFRIREYDHQSGEWKQRRFQVGIFKHKKDAQKAAEPIRAEINERNNADPKKLYARITFKEFTETYWREYAVRENHQISTIDSRRSFLDKHILPAFGEMRLREIKPSHIGTFINSLYLAEYAAGSIKAIYAFLKLLFSLAEQYDLIKKSPVRDKRHRPKVGKVKKVAWDAGQIAQVISNLPNRQEKLLALLIALTAMRKGEALALRWLDFNAETCELTINHTLYRKKIKQTKTEGSTATLQLEKAIADLLSEHRRKSPFQDSLDFIFCSEDGTPLCYQTCLDHLRQAMEMAGVKRERGKHGFHLLRHSAASMLYKQTRDPKAVQNLLRHSKIATTMDIYVHADNAVKNAGLSLLAGEILPNCDLTVTEKSELVN